MSQLLDAVDQAYIAFELLSVGAEKITQQTLIEAYSLLLSIKSVFVYKVNDRSSLEIAEEFKKFENEMFQGEIQQLLLDVAVCTSKLCYQLSLLIRKNLGGQIASKNDAKTLLDYKERNA